MNSRPSKTPLRVRAPAKLNLSLEVLGRRADGFHDIRTLMCAIRLEDTVELVPTEPSGADDAASVELLAVSGPESAGVPTDGSNIVVKALERLQAESGCPRGAVVRLHKRVPNQAGLGGGSSDAAAALHAANHAWGIGWSVERLAQLAAKIGSDLPFFVHMIAPWFGSRPARFAAACTGRGEIVRTVPSIGGAACVVLKPPFGLSTPLIYQSLAAQGYDGATGGLTDAAEAALASGNWAAVVRAMGNTLQRAAMAVEPLLQRTVEVFSTLPVLGHQLSGSGSAYFALCESHAVARRVAATLRSRGIGNVFATATY